MDCEGSAKSGGWQRRPGLCICYRALLAIEQHMLRWSDLAALLCQYLSELVSSICMWKHYTWQSGGLYITPAHSSSGTETEQYTDCHQFTGWPTVLITQCRHMHGRASAMANLPEGLLPSDGLQVEPIQKGNFCTGLLPLQVTTPLICMSSTCAVWCISHDGCMSYVHVVMHACLKMYDIFAVCTSWLNPDG